MKRLNRKPRLEAFRSRLHRLAPGLALSVIVLALPAHAAESSRQTQKPNILFIAIDDLRDWAHYLGYEQIQTPNLDRLAAMGESFTHAYCAAPACNPSRTALLTGLRPSTTGVYSNRVDWRKNPVAQSVPTIPVYFREHGYVANASGKIYHESQRDASEWDDYAPLVKLRNPPSDTQDRGVKSIKFRPLSCDDDVMPDYLTATYVSEELAKEHDKPFLLGCGFYKPHLPWEVPQKYYDLYPLEDIELPPHLEGDLDDVPAAGVAMARHGSDHKKIVNTGRWKEAVRAYLATTTFVDAQLGRVLDALEQSPYKDNTIIVLWTDHGWHLGEKEHWKKFTLWEESTRSQMLWVVPGLTKPGSTCQRTVDFMDIYPTLCELAGLPLPEHLEGRSLCPLLENPDADWPWPAITTHEFGNHAVRTEQWRYIRYEDGSEELYDHEQDPNEWENLAGDPQYNTIKEELKKWLPATNVPDPSAGKKSAGDHDDEE